MPGLRGDDRAVHGARGQGAPRGLAPLIALVAGATLLLARPLVLSRGGSIPPLLLAVLYAELLCLSLAAPHSGREAERREVNPAIAIGLGLVAVLSASRVVGQAVPVAAGATAAGLNVLAALAEEAFFRGLVYGWLRRFGPVVAVGASALAFALIHVPMYGPAALWVDLGGGLVLGWQRWATAGWAAPAATHAFANLVVMAR
jgi:membrane protease YdiL (CAAX protease family)